MERQGNQAYHKSETGEGLGVPNSAVRTGDRRRGRVGKGVGHLAHV